MRHNERIAPKTDGWIAAPRSTVVIHSYIGAGLEVYDALRIYREDVGGGGQPDQGVVPGLHADGQVADGVGGVEGPRHAGGRIGYQAQPDDGGGHVQPEDNHNSDNNNPNNAVEPLNVEERDVQP